MGEGMRTGGVAHRSAFGWLGLRNSGERKVIFLDVDGVLHSVYVQVLKDPKRCFDRNCMEVLRAVVSQTGADVVLSSNWRLDNEGLTRVKKELKDYGVRMTGKTPIFQGSNPQATRVQEISAWITENNFTGSWIAIDDMDLLNLSPEPLQKFLEGHFVKTAARGLTPDEIEKCVERLGRTESSKESTGDQDHHNNNSNRDHWQPGLKAPSAASRSLRLLGISSGKKARKHLERSLTSRPTRQELPRTKSIV